MRNWFYNVPTLAHFENKEYCNVKNTPRTVCFKVFNIFFGRMMVLPVTE